MKTTNKPLEQLAELLKTVGHPTRLAILKLLQEKEELTVTETITQLEVEQSLVSHHLDKLAMRKLLLRRREGKKIYYRLNEENPFITSIIDMVDQVFKTT